MELKTMQNIFSFVPDFLSKAENSLLAAANSLLVSRIDLRPQIDIFYKTESMFVDRGRSWQSTNKQQPHNVITAVQLKPNWFIIGCKIPHQSHNLNLILCLTHYLHNTRLRLLNSTKLQLDEYILLKKLDEFQNIQLQQAY